MYPVTGVDEPDVCGLGLPPPPPPPLPLLGLVGVSLDTLVEVPSELSWYVPPLVTTLVPASILEPSALYVLPSIE